MNTRSDKINNILKNLPKNPGIYQYFDNKGRIIYIGKSVNLKSRVNSYFNGKSKLNFAKQKMVGQIDNIEYIITNSETESLILENTLIKKHKPKYNILLKDDKNHLYIKITQDIFPKIIKTRIKNNNGTYFGPYLSGNSVHNTLKLIKKIWGYRECNIIFKQYNFTQSSHNLHNIIIDNKGSIKIPCMDYYIKRCSGPCLLEENSMDTYNKNIIEIKDFLSGNNQKIIENLKIKMFLKAKNLEFEEAQKIKQDIESIQNLDNSQIVREAISGNYLIINYLEKFDNYYIGVTNIIDGRIVGLNSYEINSKIFDKKEEIVTNFLETYIGEILSTDENIKFFNVIIPFEINKSDFLDNIITIEIPKIGNKIKLLDLTYKNVYEFAYKKHLNSLATKGFTKSNMINLLKILDYKAINKDIIFECNDISHFVGTHTVASRSVIENGKTRNSKYKKFNIKTLKSSEINDFGSMYEIMTRRCSEILKTNFIPDLIIIDGGKGQLSSVLKAISDFKINNKDTENIDLINQIQLVSIAKREEELFLPNNSESTIIDKEGLELRMIQKIRDEAHRFAINFNRDKRIKSQKNNILEALPGFGPKTRQKLIKKYGNIEVLKDIPEDELLFIINKKQLEILKDHAII